MDFDNISKFFFAFVLITGLSGFAVAEVSFETDWTHDNLDANSIGLYNSNIYAAGDDNSVYKLYADDGSEIWEYTEHSDRVRDIDVGSDEYVYSVSSDETLHKINSDGANEWTHNQGEILYAVAVDSENNVYIGGDDIYKLDSNGEQLWTYSISGGRGLEVNSDGYIYAISSDPEVRKITPEGETEWVNEDLGHNGYNIELGPEEHVYVSTVDGGDDHDDVYKITPEGETEWIYEEHEDEFYEGLYSLGVDHEGNAYSGHSANLAIHRISSEGETEGIYDEHDERSNDIEIDSDMNMYVANEDDLRKVTQNMPPKAHFDFTEDLSENVEQEPIQFFDESDPVSEEIVSWNWDFGDGTTSTQENPTHTFDEPGDYTVELTVENDDGQVDTHTEEVSVNSVPEAEFSYEPINPEPEDDIEFFDESIDEYSSIESVEWEFGDGTTSTETNPVHDFEPGEEYEVELTVTDEYGVANSTQLTLIMPEEAMTVSEYRQLYGEEEQEDFDDRQPERQTPVQQVTGVIGNIFAGIASILPF